MYNKIKNLKELNSLILKKIPIGPEELSELKNNPSLLIDTGYEYLEFGQIREAFNIFSLGVSIDKKNPEALNGLGITLCELGKLDKSKIILERALRMNPDDSITLANLAGVCWEKGDFHLAIYYYNRSIELNPGIEDIYLNVINLYLDTGYLFTAFISCSDFLNRFPKNEEANDLFDEIILNLSISIY